MIDAKDLGALARAAALGVLAIGSYEYVRVEPTAHAIVACSYCQVNQQGTYGACKKPGGGDCTQDYLSTWCTAAVDYGC